MISRAYLVLLAALPLSYGGNWTRVASPHFEIYTDRSAETAHRVLARFEQARRVLGSGTWEHASDFPVRILLFSSERQYAIVSPGSGVPGFFQSGPDRDIIAMLAGAELDRIILHEYTHSVLNHTSVPLPQWLEEGLAEFYSTLTIGERHVTAGSPVPTHVAALEREKWLSASELAGVNQKSAQYSERNKTGIFYAESWAFTHMLMLADGYRGKLPRFAEALAEGETQQDAFVTAFGKSMRAALLADLPAYLRAGFRTFEIDVAPADDIAFSNPAPLDAAAVAQARAEVLLLMGRDHEAASIYEAVARRYPKVPAAQTGLAVIAMRDRDYQKAKECFERAIELGGHDGETYFEYAMLLRDTGASAEKVDEFLGKTIEANPAHAEGHFLLGVRATDSGRYEDAIEHLRRATEILPRQAYFWQALSYACYKLGRTTEARASALRAIQCATTDHEKEMAREALKLVEAQRDRTPAGPGVITPESWNAPKGDRSITGELIQVDCERAGARLHVRTAAGTVILDVKNPRAVTIRGGGVERTLACGAQAAVAVVVEYTGRTNEVTTVEFR